MHDQSGQLLALTAAAALLAAVGAVDDMRSLPATVRLLLQCVAVGALIAALPDDLRILPQVPWWIERAGLFLGGVWFVNLVNFMDGIDWMTVAEFVPVTGAIVLIGLAGTIGLLPALVAAALLGATLGFAPFNKPVAQLFLGDVGSLPIGLLLGWLLLQLGGQGPSGGGAHPPALLSRRCDAHARSPHRKGRADLASPSHALLPARDRQRLHRCGRSSPVSFWSTWRWPRSRSSPSRRQALSCRWRALAGAAAIVAWLLVTLARGKR